MAKKQHAKHENRINPFLLFLITFSIFVLVGCTAILVVYGLKGNTNALDNQKSTMEQDQSAAVAKLEIVETDTEEIETLTYSGRYGAVLADQEQMKANNIYAKDTEDPSQVMMAFAGDILLDDNYAIMGIYRSHGNTISNCMDSLLLEQMQSADIMMLNNEFPYSNGGTPTLNKTYTFRSKPENAQILEDMGVDIVSLANNHCYDYGETAFEDTLTTLENIGLPYAGAGRNLEEASKPVYFIANDMKIGIIAATQIERLDNPDTKGATESSAGVFRCWNDEQLLATIKETKENCDFVVVYVHWGTENEAAPDWAQIEQAPQYVEAGADLIIGAHPHCLQPISYVNGVPVIYSLGNFWFNSKTVDTGMIKVAIDEKGIKTYQFIPCKQENCTTTLLTGTEKERVLEYMRSISTGISIDSDGYITNNS